MRNARHFYRYRALHIDALRMCLASVTRHLDRGDWRAADFCVRCAIAESKLAKVQP